MAAPTRTPRTSWIEEGLRALGIGGPDAVRIEALAQTLGVSKGGFYWHFDDRRALLEEMLDTWERVVIDEVVADYPIRRQQQAVGADILWPFAPNIGVPVFT